MAPGLTCKVSHLCLEKIMVQVDLMEKLDANHYEVCVCKMRESMRLTCRHYNVQYKDGITILEDVDPFWKLICDPLPTMT